jgi:prevent-host-death family protein
MTTTITIAARKFKATYLKLLDTVATGQKSFTITKCGKPIARLVPFSVSAPSRILLLDTHVFVWLLEGNARPGQNARQRIQSATNADNVLISAIASWEIAVLVSKDRLQLRCDVGEWMKKALSAFSIYLLAYSEDAKWLEHACGEKASSKRSISFQSALTVRVAALRKRALSLENIFSIGLRSGE